MPPKIFSVAEAHRRLPLIKQIISDILSKAQQLRESIEHAKKQTLIPEQVEILQIEIDGHIKELEKLGCYYKDWNFDIGLVDFPSIILEQPALLCWRSDEKFIRWYHSYEDGFVGRKLIPENLLEESKVLY